LPATAAAPQAAFRPRRSPGHAVALAALVIAAAAGGAAIATVVASRGGSGKKAAKKPTARTITHPHTAARTTVPSAPVSGDGVTLNNNGYTLMKRGEYAMALP